MRTGTVLRTRRRAAEDWEALVAGALIGSWRYRLELAMVAVVVGGQWFVAGRVGDVPAAVTVVALVVVLVAVAPTRRLLFGGLRWSWVRRSWAAAVTDAGLADGPLRLPRVVSVRRVPAGVVLRVRVPRGQAVQDLEARAERLAACLRVREVRVQRERGDGAIAEVMLVRRDPFEEATLLVWPAAGERELSLREPTPVGVDEQGAAVAIGLVERNVLVGGEPGAGKSVALSLLIAPPV